MDLRESLRAHKIPFKPGSRSDEIFICCPFCVERGHTLDVKFRFGVNVSSGLAHCFQCEWKSRNFFAFLKKKGIDVAQAAEPEPIVEEPDVAELPEGFELLYPLTSQLRSVSSMTRLAVHYALDRGITIPQLKKHHVGFTLSGRYAGRIIFPVYRKKDLVSFVARDFTGGAEKRYLNSPGAKWVWNGNAVKAHRAVCVFEGILKAMAGERALDPQSIVCVATLGRTATAAQLERIARACEVVWFPDPDVPGVEGVLISAAQGVSKIAWPLPTRQADDMSAEEIVTAWTGAQPYSTSLAVRARAAAEKRNRSSIRCKKR